jgi:hypothetical protein
MKNIHNTTQQKQQKPIKNLGYSLNWNIGTYYIKTICYAMIWIIVLEFGWIIRRKHLF